MSFAEGEPQGQSTHDKLARAVADLWSQVIESGDDYVVFHDHYGNPARVRKVGGSYYVAWAMEEGDAGVWNENSSPIDNPRQAALYAFQGPVLGRTDR